METLDVLGCDPQIYVFGKRKYKTRMTFLISLLFISLVVALVIYFGLDLIYKVKVLILSNSSTQFNHTINLSETPIMFKINDAFGNNHEKGVTYPILKFYEYYPKYNGVPNVTSITLEFCDINKHFGKYKQLYEKIDLRGQLCIPYDQYNISLSGSYGDLTNGYSKINIFVVKCEGQTNFLKENSLCYNTSIIENRLSSYTPVFTLTFLDFFIDHKNVTQAAQPYLKTDQFHIPTGANYRYTYFLKNVFYSTDFGLVFEEFVAENFYQFSDFHSELLLGQKFSVSNAYALISITNQQSGDFHSRSYTKLPVYLANVGGFINAILLITRIFLKIFIDYHLILDYSNNLVNFPGNIDSDSSIGFKKNSELNPVIVMSQNFSLNLRNNLKMKSIDIKKNPTYEKLPGFIEYHFPKICLKKTALNIKLFQQYIEKKLSTDEIIKTSHILENLKLILLEQRHINVLNQLNRISCSHLDSTDTKKLFYESLPLLNEENPIDKNLSKLLISYNNFK